MATSLRSIKSCSAKKSKQEDLSPQFVYVPSVHTRTHSVCARMCVRNQHWPNCCDDITVEHGRRWKRCLTVFSPLSWRFFFLVSGNAASHTTPKEQRDRAVTEWNMQFVGNVFTFFHLNRTKKIARRSGNSVRVQAANSIFARPHFVLCKENFWHKNWQKLYSFFFLAADVNHVPGFFHPVLFL